jgi:hypothetical protein
MPHPKAAGTPTGHGVGLLTPVQQCKRLRLPMCCVARCPYYLTAEQDLYGRLPDVESPSETAYWIDLEDVQMDKAQCSNDFMSVSSSQCMRQHCTSDSVWHSMLSQLTVCCAGISGIGAWCSMRKAAHSGPQVSCTGAAMHSLWL